MKRGWTTNVTVEPTNPLELKFSNKDKDVVDDIKGQLNNGKSVQTVNQDEFERLLLNMQDIIQRREKKMTMIDESLRAIEELSIKMRDCMLVLESLETQLKKGNDKYSTLKNESSKTLKFYGSSA